MTDNVVRLDGTPAPKPGEPVASLVEMLTDLLEMAKTGELQSLVGTGFTSDNCRLALWHISNHTNVYEALGAISWLQHEYVARIAGTIET